MEGYNVGDLTKTLLEDQQIENDFFQNAVKPIETENSEKSDESDTEEEEESRKRKREDQTEEELNDEHNEKLLQLHVEDKLLETQEEDAQEESEDDDDEPPRKKQKTTENDPSKDIRTIFVSNFPIRPKYKAIQKDLKKFFSQVGPIESVRVRHVPIVKDTKLPRSAAIKRNLIDSERLETVCAYVVFEKESDANAALSLNTTLYKGKHLGIDLAIPRPLTNSEHRRCVFLGNLPFDVQDEEIWKLFEKKSNKFQIERVRVVRDKQTLKGKGFAFVMFKEREQAEFAVSLNQKLKLRDRLIRIKRSDRNEKTRIKPKFLERIEEKKKGKVKIEEELAKLPKNAKKILSIKEEDKEEKKLPKKKENKKKKKVILPKKAIQKLRKKKKAPKSEEEKKIIEENVKMKKELRKAKKALRKEQKKAKKEFKKQLQMTE